MLGVVERFIAWRYLRPKRDDRFLSVIAGFSFIGIAIGVATLIIVMSVMNGFRQELLKQILGVNGHVTIYAVGESFRNYEDIAFDLQRRPEVQSVMPMVEGQAMLTINGDASGVAVRGIKASDLKLKPTLIKNLSNPALDEFYGRDVVIIGQQMAARYGIGVGDSITLVAPEFHETAFGSVPRLKTFRVVDSFKTGMYEYDRNFVYMPLEAAQLFFQYGDGVPALEVFARQPEALQPLITHILDTVDMPINVRDWREANSSFINALQVERNVMFLILTLIILVAAFNIISILIMLVKDKGRDIAILRTMGASRRQIVRIFMLNGITIGIVGTLVGFAGGVLFTLNIDSIRQFFEELLGTNLFPGEIYFLSTLPAQIDWLEVSLVVGMTMVLSFLATLYPAWRAASVDPVEMLRNG